MAAPKFRPVLDHIIFVFEDKLATFMGIKQFEETTKWGFKLGSSFDNNLKAARWGIIVAVGPNVKDKSLEQGARVLIEPLKWTEGVKYEGNLYWMTKEDHIFLVDDDPS